MLRRGLIYTMVVKEMQRLVLSRRYAYRCVLVWLCEADGWGDVVCGE